MENQLKDWVGIYSGSFNPLHQGHLSVKNIAQKVLGCPVIFELSIHNTDKGFIDYVDLNNRITGLKDYPVILTNKSRYVDKMVALKKAFSAKKGIIFIVGADTWERIWDSKYGVSINELFDTFSNENVKFLVFSRDGKTIECIKNKVNAANLNMFNWIMTYLVVPSKEALDFNISMNSTAIRQSQNN